MEENKELDSEFDAEEIPSPSDLWNYMEHYWHNNREFPENTEDLLKRKADLIEGKVPSSQLPNYVNDILEFESLENLPNPGEKGKIYIITQNNTQFRWSGSEYIQLNSEEYLMTTDTNQSIYATKYFNTEPGNNWYNNKLVAYSAGVANPGMSFYKEGVDSAQLKFNGNWFYLTNSDGSISKPLLASAFIKDGSDNNHVLLGGGGHKPLSDFATSTQLGNYVTIATPQEIEARKIFRPTGNTYDTASLELRGSNASGIFPTLSFHQPGLYAATLSYRGEGFHFMNANANGYDKIYVNGVVKAGSNDDYVLLGGGSHKPVSDFITNDSTNNIIGAKWFKTDGGNNWYNNTARIHGINGYDAGLTFYRDGIDVGQIIFDGYYFNFTNSDNSGFKEIRSAGFIKNGSDTNHVLLGDGGHRAVSDFATSAQLGNYLPLSGGTLTGGGRIRDNGNIYIQQVNVGGNATGLFWETMDDSAFTAGIGAYTENGNFYWNYLGWGSYPWSTATSLAVGENIFTYKDNQVWHQGNLEDYHQYGLGKLYLETIPNANTFNTKKTGFYSLNDTVNAPFQYGTTIKLLRDDNEGGELAISTLGANLAFREYVGGNYSQWYYTWHTGNFNPSNYLQNGSAIQVDSTDYINNGSNIRSNKTWFDYGWADTYAGSVINFSGYPSSNYSTELFGQYNAGGNRFGLRTHNGDTNTWNPVRWIWHSGNFNPDEYLTQTQSDNRYLERGDSTVRGLGFVSGNTDNPYIYSVSGTVTYLATQTWVNNQGFITQNNVPVATNNIVGGIRLISDTKNNIAPQAVTTVTDRSYAIQLNNNNQAVVNVPWIDPTTLGYATQSWVDNVLTDYAHKADANTFTKVNTFDLSPRVPAGVNGSDAVNVAQLFEVASSQAVETVNSKFITEIMNTTFAAFDTSGMGYPLVLTVIAKSDGELRVEEVKDGRSVKVRNVSSGNLEVRINGGTTTIVSANTWADYHSDGSGDITMTSQAGCYII